MGVVIAGTRNRNRQNVFKFQLHAEKAEIARLETQIEWEQSALKKEEDWLEKLMKKEKVEFPTEC